MIDTENITEKHESVMTIEKLIESTKDSVIDFISSFLKTNKKVIREQFDNLYDYTKYQIITYVLYAYPAPNGYWNPEHKKVLTEFLENIFEKPVVHISDFYKQLSEKFNGKYSPEELELICECEKNLAVNLLKTNDVVETKIAAFAMKYNENGDPSGINTAIQSDFMEIFKK